MQSFCVLNGRLKLATRVELDRLCLHLGILKGASIEEIEQAYLKAADNSIFRAIRDYISNEAPTYLKALHLIYKELRPYSLALDETWSRVKESLGSEDYKPSIEAMDEFELEDKILGIYKTEFEDAQAKAKADYKFAKTITKYIPGIGTAGAGAATTISALIAARAPFAALGPGALAGPVGIALGVISIGTKLSGPDYSKIIPTTVEIMLIGKRFEFMPKE